MKKQLSIFVVVLALAACSPEQNALNKPPGSYEKTVSTTDSKGTTTKQKSSTEVTVDEQGRKKAVVQSKTTKDPKGLFNKTTTQEYKGEVEEK